jgi:glycine C-acetyltransferase
MATPVANRLGASDQALNLHHFLTSSHTMDFNSRLKAFSRFTQIVNERKEFTYCRLVTSPPGRTVKIWDPVVQRERDMLMFASNNYLGLANHPYVQQKVKAAIKKYGTGLAGPPLLNGFTVLMQELEARLASLKHQEAALIFPSGYMSNLGMVNALVKGKDKVVFDEQSHASFYDALKMAKVDSVPFSHNNLVEMEAKLEAFTEQKEGAVFVSMEGVYSMDGDLAPLDQIIPIVKRYGAITMLDDAHGTGVLGRTGSGTAEHLGVAHEIDLSMGTFSKSFAMTGGFVAGSKDAVNYMRFFARPYMFSAALPPASLAAVLAGIDVIENEPWLRDRLLDNARYGIGKLRPLGFMTEPGAAIVALKAPDWMDMRRTNYYIHERGIFLNAIEYPAVREDKQRFRITFMAEHTREDIDRLVDVLEEAWHNPALRKEEQAVI